MLFKHNKKKRRNGYHILGMVYKNAINICILRFFLTVLFFTGLDNGKEILKDAMLDQWKDFVRMAWDDSLHK